jgi:hypothetical protein
MFVCLRNLLRECGLAEDFKDADSLSKFSAVFPDDGWNALQRYKMCVENTENMATHI